MIVFLVSSFGILILLSEILELGLLAGFSLSVIYLSCLGLLVLVALLALAQYWQLRKAKQQLQQSHKKVMDQKKESAEQLESIIQSTHRINFTEKKLAELTGLLSSSRTENEKVQLELDSLRSEKILLNKKANENEANSAEGDLLTLLGSLQNHGRFLDFIMGDISQYPDAQVGAAARVVHRGCSATIEKFFKIEPVSKGSEGETISLTDQSLEAYKLIGETEKDSPKQGRLVHKGWKTSRIDLPKRVEPVDEEQMIISPAEVEL